MEYLPPDGNNAAVTRYVLHSGASLFYEEDVKPDGSTEQRAYLSGPLGVVAVATTSSGTGSTTLTYWHRDHLGSVGVTTNEQGSVLNRSRFDPWGKPMTSLGARAGTGDRGFTGHEHLAGGLIHMNGRIYDPVLGRFLSADIVVQSPGHIVSYNRYAYVMNNPLVMTDPSGYFFVIDDLLLLAAALVKAAPIIMTVTTVAANIAIMTGHETAGMRIFFAGMFLASGGGFGGGFLNAVAGGFAMGGLQSGGIEGAIQGAVGAAFMYGAGTFADASMNAEAAAITGGAPGEFAAAQKASMWATNGIGRAGMHAVAGCAIGAMDGGGCGRGAASAGFSEYAGRFIPGGDASIAQFAGKVVVGGVASVLGGGKFANGARTAAFGYLFNFLSHATYSLSSRILTVVDSERGEVALGRFKSATDAGVPPTPGTYEILESTKGWFRLERRDSHFGNDIDSSTGQMNIRLHGPGLSYGCVTAETNADWERVRDVIQNTKSKSLVVNTYYDPIASTPANSLTTPNFNFRIRTGAAWVKWYGTLTVVP